ncbi:NUDIX hydrolase [Rhodalgimonas zhirmunskyi]|uniref:NUDIX hydrolase n=1 Tax=Rhodalgimonas zhirmunskyi TaxID=2964767 RepID=A0AAJ1X364_9RHOB|nr:NUDIX hydrolase [Rhodoalgimonas zhirmunskyi]MDQ2093008.1 NUDIX hydrolase [Rhodoalgimonas zhirmunskyi]
MSMDVARQVPLSIPRGPKGEMRAQFAALCWRVKNGKPQILLITSRGTNRWILPKGWPESGMTPGQAALQEAWEEAGVRGRASEISVGVFSYMKKLEKGVQFPCVALVYPIRVKQMADDYPEAGERRRKWFSPKKAAARVSEPDLKHLLLHFDPRGLR